MRLTGLSRATIDRALNGRAGVQAKTQALVNAAIQDLTLSSEAKHRVGSSRGRNFVCVVQAGDAFAQSIVDECAALAPEFERRGVALAVVPCVSVSNEQVAETILGQAGADGLIVIAKNAPPIANATMALRAGGAAIVAVQSDLDFIARHAYVGIDNRVAGQTAGFLMGRGLPPDSTTQVAFMVDTVYYRCHEEREMGFRTTIRQRFPWFSVIDVVMNGDNDQAAYRAISALLDEHPDIGGLYNTAGGNEGVARALRERARIGKTIFIAHEYNPATERQIRAGAIDFLLSQDLESILLQAIECLVSVLEDNQHSQQITAPLEIICPYSLPPRETHLLRTGARRFHDRLGG